MLTMSTLDADISAIHVFTVFSMYSPDGTNLYGSRGGKSEGDRVGVGNYSCKIVPMGHFLFTCLDTLL